MASSVALIICLLPGILAQCNLERAQPLFKRSVYEFSTALTSRIAQEKNNHFVASTFSPWTLLATASLGAAGVTREELVNVLRLNQYECFNQLYFELARTITGEGNVTLERSSIIFVDNSKYITPEFKAKIDAADVTNIEPLTVDSNEIVAATINDYVRRATRDTISDIVAPSDLNGVYVTFIDAQFFKGRWQVPFLYEETEVRAFYNGSGVHIGEVYLMSVTDEFQISEIELLNAKVLELPFGTDGRFSMLFFLPEPGTTLSTVIDSLNRVNLTTIYKILEQKGYQSVAVQIPRFKISSDLDNLKELLSDMGLRSAFESESGDFRFLSDESLYISNFIQKAGIEVNEEGASASATTEALPVHASSCKFMPRSEPKAFYANRPFLYMIIDKQTQVPLFIGAYSNYCVY